MKNGALVSLAAFLLAVLLIGCGGGGGGGGTNGGNGGSTGNSPYQGQYLEFVGINRGGNLEPLSLEVGDAIQVVIANYDPAGNRTELPASNLTCSAPSSDISLSSNGRLNVVRRPAGIFSVSARTKVAGVPKTIQQDGAAPPPSLTTTASGKVIAGVSLIGIKYVQVTFYDASGAAVAGVRTGDNGIYKAKIPANVASVSIKGSTVPAPPYYRSYYYGGKIYTMDASVCPLKLIGIKSGQNNPLSSMSIFRQEDGPPPPPDGCKP